jgi:hypothetical protein
MGSRPGRAAMPAMPWLSQVRRACSNTRARCEPRTLRCIAHRCQIMPTAWHWRVVAALSSARRRLLLPNLNLNLNRSRSRSRTATRSRSRRATRSRSRSRTATRSPSRSRTATRSRSRTLRATRSRSRSLRATRSRSRSRTANRSLSRSRSRSLKVCQPPRCLLVLLTTKALLMWRRCRCPNLTPSRSRSRSRSPTRLVRRVTFVQRQVAL